MTAFEEITEPVTRTQIVRFAGAGGDFNPMHHDEAFATGHGQPSVFAMGQLQAAMLAAALVRCVGRENVVGYGVRFRDKVWPGDRLVLRGAPAATADGIVRYYLEARRQRDDVVVISGWARVREPAG